MYTYSALSRSLHERDGRARIKVLIAALSLIVFLISISPLSPHPLLLTLLSGFPAR